MTPPRPLRPRAGTTHSQGGRTTTRSPSCSRSWLKNPVLQLDQRPREGDHDRIIKCASEVDRFLGILLARVGETSVLLSRCAAQRALPTETQVDSGPPAAPCSLKQIRSRTFARPQTRRSRGISQQFAWYRAGRDHHDDTLSAIFVLDVTIFTTWYHPFLENRIVLAFY